MAVESRGGTWRAGVLSFLTLRALGDGSAAGCFLFGTFLYSWVPVSVTFSGGAGSPLLYGVGLRLCFVVSRECSGSPWAATGAPPSPWASRAGDATRT